MILLLWHIFANKSINQSTLESIPYLFPSSSRTQVVVGNQIMLIKYEMSPISINISKITSKKATILQSILIPRRISILCE